MTPPPGVFTRHDWPHVAGGTVRPRRFGPDHVELRCDALIIGSGAGGSVVAAELAEAGLDVLVLEEGGYYPTQSFTTDEGAALRALYRDGGAQMTLGVPPVTWAEGACVGGSTVLNGAMSWRTPERILERWHREDWVDAILAPEMERYFQRVEGFISSSPQDPWTIGRDNQLLKQGADALGWHVLDNIRNQLHCAGSNNCAWGCPTGAKRSALVTYVPRALHFGARLLANCRVERLVLERKRVVGARGRVVLANGRAGCSFEVRADLVVTACGAIQTPALLLRSGIRSPSGNIGRRLALHPNCKVVAIFDEPVRGWEGVHQAYQVREFQPEGFLFAAVNIPPSLTAMSMPAYGRELADIMRHYDRMVVAGMLVEDTVFGRVRAVGGRAVATYQLAEFDAERLVRGTALLSELLFKAGARRIIIPFEGVPELRGPEDVRRLYAARIPLSAMEVVTVHVMGTAAMGGDRLRHVCDSAGKVYNAGGLYVADASLFPSPIGVNPMETVMALATRVAERILQTRPARRAQAVE